MLARSIGLLPLLLLTPLLAACAGKGTKDSTPPAAEKAIANEHAFFDAQGAPSTFEAFVESIADTDFIAYGEMHYHVVGSRYELELLEAMSKQERPVVLAMEFFEADHQAALDQYLAGEIDEAAFREQTKRDDKYEGSHRPLIEFCKANGIPVIAANAPRRLVTGYRKSGIDGYEEYLASLSEEDRAFMPRTSVPPDDEFKERFMKLMGPDRGPRFYKSMALWNDAMAESSADFREEHPEHRVLLVVGSFHVARHLGTVTQYLQRRPDDDAKVLAMQPTEGEMKFSEEDRGQGDLILKVREGDSL